MEQTLFKFEVLAAHLTEALDIFAQFFISPSFTASAVDREMNAVDSENTKNIQSDLWRWRHPWHLWRQWLPSDRCQPLPHRHPQQRTQPHALARRTV